MAEESLAQSVAGGAGGEAPPFELPRVLTFRGDDILQLLGPAQACSFASSVVCAPGTGGLINPAKLAGLNWPPEA